MNIWLRRHPLAAFLPLQALIYCWNLSLLSPWGDESGTLLMVRGPLGTLIRWAAEDVHPPLYYSLLYYWQRIPLGIDWVVQARLLSVLFALLGTVAVDRLWGTRFEQRTRLTLLALWTLSPCLLLYARMCRSYTLQALIAIVAVALISRTAAETTRREEAGRGAGRGPGGPPYHVALLALVLLAAIYTHYVAGLALLATANLSLLFGGPRAARVSKRLLTRSDLIGNRLLTRAARWKLALAVDLAVLIGYLPWIWRLVASLASWGSPGRNYTLTGSPILELPVKFAYWTMSFVMGEAVPDPILILGALLLPLIAALAWKGARRTPEVAWLALQLAVIGFIGVARWVSYPFIPARLLFVLPFFLLLLAQGAADRPRWGNPAIAAMLLLSLSGIACYFLKAGFRNKEYPMPIREIATEILRASGPDNSAILVDSTNSDPIGMLYQLHPHRTFLQTSLPETPAALAALLANPQIRTVWFLRNTHDVSPTALNAQFQTELRARMTETVHPYEPYTPLERILLGPKSPQYFQELLEFRR